MSLADNIKRLKQWHAGLHHGRKLPSKKREFFLRNRLTAATTFFDLGDINALTTQICRRTRLAKSSDFSFD